MAFILGQLKLEEFGLRPECEYATRKQQVLAAYAEQRGPGAILDSEVFAEPIFEHATKSFIGSLINRHSPAPKSNDNSPEALTAQPATTTAPPHDVPAYALDRILEREITGGKVKFDPPAPLNVGSFPASVSEVNAAIASVEEKYGPERTLSLKRDAKPPLSFIFKQIVDCVIKAEYDRWQPALVEEVKRFIMNPDTYMPMMAIDRNRANHIASICSQVIERDLTVRADGELFYKLLIQNRSQLKHYVKELDL